MTELNSIGGALGGDCPWYVERRADSEVFDRLVRGEDCYVLTSHQMGKSSLVVRLRDKLRHRGARAAAIDLTAFGRELSASQWYNALSVRIGRELHLEGEFETFLAAHKSLAPFDRFCRALDCCAPRTVSSPLILFVDELDLLRSLPFSPGEFLRAIHSAAARADGDRSRLQQVVFCLFATVPPSALWREAKPEDPGLGHVLSLQDFERQELFRVIDGLARGLLQKSERSVTAGLARTKFVLGEILDRVFHWTHGHPYLTQKLGCVATNGISGELDQADEITPEQCRRFVDSLSEKLFTNDVAWEQECHLLWVRQKLLRGGLDPSRLLDLVQSVRHGLPADLLGAHESEALVSSGVVCIRDGSLEMRNRIYQRLFDDGWLCSRLHAPAFPTAVPRASGLTVFA